MTHEEYLDEQDKRDEAYIRLWGRLTWVFAGFLIGLLAFASAI